MSLLSKMPVQGALKHRRIPNAFMLFVKEQKGQLVQKCPEEYKSVIGAYLGKKWRSMGLEEKKVYYDRYNALKRLSEDEYAFASVSAVESKMSEKELLEEIREITGGAYRNFEETETIGSTTGTTNKRKDEGCNDKASGSKFTSFLSEPVASTSESTNERKDEGFKNKPSGSKKLKAKRMRELEASSESGKMYKKVRRTPNAFMLFAKEERKKLQQAPLKSKAHVSTILGNMWKELDKSEKKKYFEKAKAMETFQKKKDKSAASSAKVTKKKGEPSLKAKRSVGRPPKKTTGMATAPKSSGRKNKASVHKLKQEVSEKRPKMKRSVSNESASSAAATGECPHKHESTYPSYCSHTCHTAIQSHHSEQPGEFEAAAAEQSQLTMSHSSDNNNESPLDYVCLQPDVPEAEVPRSARNESVRSCVEMPRSSYYSQRCDHQETAVSGEAATDHSRPEQCENRPAYCYGRSFPQPAMDYSHVYHEPPHDHNYQQPAVLGAAYCGPCCAARLLSPMYHPLDTFGYPRLPMCSLFHHTPPQFSPFYSLYGYGMPSNNYHSSQPIMLPPNPASTENAGRSRNDNAHLDAASEDDQPIIVDCEPEVEDQANTESDEN